MLLMGSRRPSMRMAASSLAPMAPQLRAWAQPRYRVEVLDDGIVRAATFGDLTEEDADTYLQALGAAIRQVGEPLRILGDARQAGKHTKEARRFLRDSFIAIPPCRMAVVGAGPAKRLFVWLLLHNSLVRQLRFFDGEAEALAWLRGP